MLKVFYPTLIYPLLRAAMRIVAFKNQKVQQGLELRKAKPWRDLPSSKNDKPTVWFHVSSGEFEYAKPVISILKNRGYQILVTYFSPSVLKSLQNSKDVDFFCPTPWETSHEWDAFFKTHQPRVLAIARTDLWPQMIWGAKRHKIPVILFSTTLPSSSQRVSSPLGRWLYRKLLQNVDKISCVTQEDRSNVERILGTSMRQIEVAVEGDTRYDQVLARLQEQRPTRADLGNWRAQNPERLVFIAGSTWPEDEEHILPQLPQMKKLGWVVILVPHEPNPNHIEKIKKNLSDKGLETQLYSSPAPFKPESILIVDKVGILADLYRLADVAFVGGSFRKTVHSVMEPNALGVFTIFGPKFQNNREAIALSKRGLNKSISTGKDFFELISAESSLISATRLSRRRQIELFIKENSGVSEKTASWIEEKVKKNRPHLN